MYEMKRWDMSSKWPTPCRKAGLGHSSFDPQAVAPQQLKPTLVRDAAALPSSPLTSGLSLGWHQPAGSWPSHRLIWGRERGVPTQFIWRKVFSTVRRSFAPWRVYAQWVKISFTGEQFIVQVLFPSSSLGHMDVPHPWQSWFTVRDKAITLLLKT